MKSGAPLKNPWILSGLIHAALIAVWGAFFWAQDHRVEDIPVEITEFIRHLQDPSPSSKPTGLPKKSVSNAPAPANPAPSDGSSTNTAPQGGGSAEGVAEDYEVSEMPLLLNEVRVPYPPAAKARSIQGNVVFEILIASDGSVRDLKVVSSPDAVLTEAAEKAVRLFKFRPAKMGDKSVAIRIRYTYRFLLQ